jgi:hypothetical protein
MVRITCDPVVLLISIGTISSALYRCVVIATEHTEDAAMLHGNVLPQRPFWLIAGVMAN